MSEANDAKIEEITCVDDVMKGPGVVGLSTSAGIHFCVEHS